MQKLFFFICLVWACSSCNPSTKNESITNNPSDSRDSITALVTRGKYLVGIQGCNDCHSPKVMTPHGPEPDTTRLLSGHPQNETLPAIPANSQNWILFSQGLTGFVGPWGTSFAANITPDDTGIGAWSYKQFETSIRKGKYKGLEESRNLLPPMPWTLYRALTDEDLKAVFTYLKSIKPVNNVVPSAIPPSGK